MAVRSKKEQQQIMILGAMFLGILLTIAYTQRALFLPPPVSEVTLSPETRAAITVKATDQLFGDTRFTSLKNHVDPVVAPTTTGNGDLFAVPSR
jgi:hypothetical protein